MLVAKSTSETFTACIEWRSLLTRLKQQAPPLEVAVAQGLHAQLLGIRQGRGAVWDPGVVRQAQVAEHMRHAGVALGLLVLTVRTFIPHTLGSLHSAALQSFSDS